MPKKKVVRRRPTKPKDLWEVSLTDTISTAHSYRNKQGQPVPLSMDIRTDVLIGRTAGEVMGKFRKSLLREGKYNLNEMRDARYGRYVIGASSRRANPQRSIYNKYPNLLKQLEEMNRK